MQPRRVLFLSKLLGLLAVAAAAAVWHHGHIRNFLLAVGDALAPRLSKSRRKYSLRMQPSLLQVYRGDPAIHYEVWVQRKTRSLEIGLHFEGAREENYRWAQALAARVVEIQRALGPQAELEEWTRKWTRLHETRVVGGDPWRPSQDLTQELAKEVAERLASYIEALEPILAQERAGVVG